MACSARVSSLRTLAEKKHRGRRAAREGYVRVREVDGDASGPHLLEGGHQSDRQVAACLLHSMNDWQKKTEKNPPTFWEILERPLLCRKMKGKQGFGDQI